MSGSNQDNLLNLAFALHSNPGVYAILLGSGVSRSAGILTGWEIVLELISKIAAADGAAIAGEPDQWYAQRFGEPAEYTRVLARLATTAAERRALLHGYFEPTEQDREQGLKVPSPAHRAIASLVKSGHFRLAITTNFDRLLELALADEGIAPDVIASDDALQGAIPLVHSKCMLVKLNGDYLDTRIKNTGRELSKYSVRMNAFLDRVLDEFGLVVCGWSGQWDTALASAILRCPNRRFTTYWLTRSQELKPDAQGIVEQRRALLVRVASADAGFQQLLEKVRSIELLGTSSPVSTDVAVATVKRYLSDTRYRIQLEELLRDEVEVASAKVAAMNASVDQPNLVEDDLRERMQRYEAAVDKLVPMAAALAYYAEDAYNGLLTRLLERLTIGPGGGGTLVLLHLRSYPALLLAYSAGIAALAGEKYENLAHVLLQPQYRDHDKAPKEPAIRLLSVMSVFYGGGQWIPRPQPREYTPGSNYLAEVMRPILKPYLASDIEYADAFDTFEYILGLAYADLLEEKGPLFGVPVGRHGWRWRGRQNDAPWAQFVQAGENRGLPAALLRAGFFRGSADRMRVIFDLHQASVASQTSNW